MGSILGTGLLGFVSGFAEGKADAIDLEEKRAYEESLRLRSAEAAALKERRLLTLKSNFKIQENKEGLIRDGLRNEDGTFNNTELLPREVAAGLNDSNVREAWKNYYSTIAAETKEGRGVERAKGTEGRALETTIAKEARTLEATIAKEGRGVTRAIDKEGRQIVGHGPGTTVSTRKQVLAKLEKGPFRTADLQKDKSTIKANYGMAKFNARAQFKSQVGAFSSENRKALSQSNILDISEVGSKMHTAYKSMVGIQALNATILEHDDRFAKEFSSLEGITSTQLVQAAAAKADEIDEDFRNIYEQLERKMQAALDQAARDKDNSFDKTKFAKDLITKAGEFTSTEGEPFNMNPKQAMKDDNQWHESMEAILMNTLLELFPNLPQKQGFFERRRK